MRFLILWAVAFMGMSNVAIAEPVITVEKSLCEAYKPTQSAAYVEGVDVNGNQVAPANLANDNMITFNDPIEIPLTIDLAQRLNLDIKGMELKQTLGMISINKEGNVTFNGKDISSNTKTLCENYTAPKPLAVPMAIADEPPSSDVVAPLPATVSPSVTVTE